MQATRHLLIVFSSLVIFTPYILPAIIKECAKAGMFALTFDEGPSENLSYLLEQLASANNTLATFHFVTKNLNDPNLQELVKRVAAAGHEVGLETDSNWDLSSMPSKQITGNINRTAAILSQYSGYRPRFIRIPYASGNEDSRVISAVEASGLKITMQNLESYDTTQDAAGIENTFMLAVTLVAPGSGKLISVQRDAVRASADAIPNIVRMLNVFNYTLVKLDDCTGLDLPDIPVRPEDFKAGGVDSSGNPTGSDSIDSDLSDTTSANAASMPKVSLQTLLSLVGTIVVLMLV